MPSAYHHGNLREALVEEGFALARTDGADGVALREVARRVGVSHNAAYRHFADRSALLGEIAGRAMTMIVEAMGHRLAAVPGDLDDVARARWRLSAVGRSYVEFALAEPGLFEVAFSSLTENSSVALGEGYATAGPFQVLSEALDRLVDVGYLDPRRRPGAEIACWSAVHGLAVLALDGPLRVVGPQERATALDHVLATLDAGLGVPGPIVVTDAPADPEPGPPPA